MVSETTIYIQREDAPRYTLTVVFEYPVTSFRYGYLLFLIYGKLYVVDCTMIRTHLPLENGHSTFHWDTSIEG